MRVGFRSRIVFLAEDRATPMSLIPVDLLSFRGSAEDVYESLRPVVPARGKSFLKYQEHSQEQKSRMEPDRICNSMPALEPLFGLANNLSSQGDKVEKAMRTMLKNHHAEVMLQPKDEEDWVRTMMVRIRCCCYACHNGSANAIGAPCIQKLLW